MWEPHVPDADDLLRQGDLLSDVPFPRRGTFELTPESLRADVYPKRHAIVLDQCCTVAQKYTVLIARIGVVRRLPPEHQMMQSLARMVPEPNLPYAKYLHPLMELGDHLPFLEKKVHVVEMTERLSLAVKGEAELGWLQQQRVARMTATSRAHLRLRMAAHFTEVAEDDVEELQQAGVDKLGRPIEQ